MNIVPSNLSFRAPQRGARNLYASKRFCVVPNAAALRTARNDRIGGDDLKVLHIEDMFLLAAHHLTHCVQRHLDVISVNPTMRHRAEAYRPQPDVRPIMRRL